MKQLEHHLPAIIEICTSLNLLALPCSPHSTIALSYVSFSILTSNKGVAGNRYHILDKQICDSIAMFKKNNGKEEMLCFL